MCDIVIVIIVTGAFCAVYKYSYVITYLIQQRSTTNTGRKQYR